MFRQLNFRSFFNFLGRNKLYAAINIFGLSVSLMFVILIADYTLRQLTCDDYHAKADRIYVIGNEERITSGYYLQKYLRDRYPEIESTCAVAVSGQSTDATQPVEVGLQKYSATILFADTTFFRIFDYQLLDGDREQVLASRDNVVLSESFARKVFGTFNPMGQVIRFPDEEKSYVVSGVVRDIDRSVIPNMDIIMRAERLCDINSANDEHMSNSGAVTTFILARPGADLTAKIPDMLDYFKEIYWIYKGNVYQHVTLTPLRDVYFLSQNNDGGFNYGSWPFVMILFGVGAVILLFAVMNYINLTVAQTGFRAKEMAARRLLGASRGEIILKLILESTFLCVVAFVIALFLAAAVEPGASRLLGSKIGVWQDMTPAVVACYAAFIVVLGVVAGFIPAMMVSRYKPVDIVRGSFRHRTKMFYSKVLITIQNVITIVLIATSLTIGLQIRHLISAPMGYNTADILDISTEIFLGKKQIAQFREELLREPCVEAVALGCGTPHDRGNNNTMQYGPDRMIGFQIFIGDSTYFRILGLERLRDNHLARMNDDNMVFINQHALRELGIAEDAEEFKVGMDYSYPYQIAGIYRDFQIGSARQAPIGDAVADGRHCGYVPVEYPGQNPRGQNRGLQYGQIGIRTYFRRCGLYRGGVYRAGNRSRLCRAAADPAHRRHLHARGDPDLGARSGGHVDLLHPAEGAGGRRAQGLRLDARRGARAPGGKLHAAGRCGVRPRRARGVVPARTLVAGLQRPDFALAPYFSDSRGFCRRGGVRRRLLAEQPCGRFQPGRLD